MRFLFKIKLIDFPIVMKVAKIVKFRLSGMYIM